MTGDLCLYRPGEEPTMTLVADANGDVPTRGDPLEIVGEGPNHPRASAVTDTGNFVATLVDLPADYDGETSGLAAGEIIGPATVRVTHYVDWIPEDAANPVAAGEAVVVGADGARPLNAAGGDTPDMIVGTAWKTTPSDSGTGGKVAVVRSGR